MVGRILAQPPPKLNVLRSHFSIFCFFASFFFRLPSSGNTRYRLEANPLVWHRANWIDKREAQCQMGKHDPSARLLSAGPTKCRETSWAIGCMRFFFHQAINYRFSMSIDKFIRLRKCVGHFIVPRFVLVPSVTVIDGYSIEWFFFLLRIRLGLHRPPHVWYNYKQTSTSDTCDFWLFGIATHIEDRA